MHIHDGKSKSLNLVKVISLLRPALMSRPLFSTQLPLEPTTEPLLLTTCNGFIWYKAMAMTTEGWQGQSAGSNTE